MRKRVLLFLIVCSLDAGAVNKWNGIVRKEWDDSEKWVQLTAQLKEKHFYFGTVASARRIIQYFYDLKSKTYAFQTLVDSTDIGYPFSLADDFISGDIETTALDGFSQSYNLYKATVNAKKNMQKWSENYFNRIDKKNFPKYLFYQALESAKKKKFNEAVNFLEDALSKAKGPENATLAKKAARTLARLYYEKTYYGQAFDIYQNFLLRHNPVDNNDWIEAAWTLYRLNRFEDALGFLYNLELSGPEDALYLEKFTIRALIYREKCDSIATAKVAQAFAKEYGPTLEGIKLGKPLRTFPLLKRIFLGMSDYYKSSRVLIELKAEKDRIKELPPEMQAMASYLYASEIGDYEKIHTASEDEALDQAARSLVILNESLRFLAFDVAREKFNPDKVFEEAPPEDRNLVTADANNQTFVLHWMQWGDFWRDERLLYRGMLKNKCQ